MAQIHHQVCRALHWLRYWRLPSVWMSAQQHNSTPVMAATSLPQMCSSEQSAAALAALHGLLLGSKAYGKHHSTPGVILKPPFPEKAHQSCQLLQCNFKPHISAVEELWFCSLIILPMKKTRHTLYTTSEPSLEPRSTSGLSRQSFKLHYTNRATKTS